MAERRFDLCYRGLLRPGADPDDTRRRLGATFKLKEAGLDRLFTGRPVIVKRDVDAATAAHFERLFAQAGAELTLVPVDKGGSLRPRDPTPSVEVEQPRSVDIDVSRLSLAPPGGALEEPPPGVPLNFDLSHLSLVEGDDWTLEDCEPPPTPIPLPDLSYLTLVPLPDTEPRSSAARFL
jgi:hypothetical protein